LVFDTDTTTYLYSDVSRLAEDNTTASLYVLAIAQLSGVLTKLGDFAIVYNRKHADFVCYFRCIIMCSSAANNVGKTHSIVVGRFSSIV
jgi:hypothetical protein